MGRTIPERRIDEELKTEDEMSMSSEQLLSYYTKDHKQKSKIENLARDIFSRSCSKYRIKEDCAIDSFEAAEAFFKHLNERNK